jgi:hypothetical protein
MYSRSITIATLLTFVLSTSAAFGQCGCSAPATTSAPVVSSYTAQYAPVTTYYAPATDYATYYSPTTTYYAPTTAYYAPTTTYYAPQPYVSYYTPSVSYYAPTTAYSPVAAPVATPYTSYYAPAGASVMAGSSIYGTPKVYVYGQPIRNAIRASTP